MAEVSNSNPVVESTQIENNEIENSLDNQEVVEGEELSSEEKPLEDLSNKDQKVLAKQLKKYKLKVHGREVEEELDLNDDEAIKNHLQMSRAAQVRMQEATEFRKSAEQFIEMLRTNPRKVLSDPSIGVDLKKFATDIINQEIEDSTKSPEQLEKEQMQKELSELKEKYEKEEKTRKSQEFSRLQAEQEEKIQSDIELALNSNELPKTPYTVRKMAEMMMLALQNDIDLSPKDLVPLLRKQMNVDIKELLAASADDVLEELIGKDNISRVRKKNLAKMKQPPVAQTAGSIKPTGNTPKPAGKEEPKQSIKDWLRG